MATGTTTTRKLNKKRPELTPQPQPDWQSPRVPQPEDAITSPVAKLNALQQA